MKSRNNLIDAAKGLGILLVVLGHVIQANLPDPDDNIVFRLIYSFHMPLFMFLSGMVAKYGSWSNVSKNIIRLVLPFVCWYIIGYFIKSAQHGDFLNVQEHFVKLVRNPDWGLWFLWVLFLCHCFFYIMYACQQRLGLAGLILVFLFIQVIPISIFGFSLLKLYFPYFVCGFLAMTHRNKVVRYRGIYIFISFCIFIVLVPFWQRDSGQLIMQELSFLPNWLIRYDQYIIRLYKYFIGLAGIVTALGLCYYGIKLKSLRMFLVTIGLYTLEIYVSHQLFCNLGFGDSLIMIIISSFAVALGLSLLISFLLKKIPIIRTCLYGVTAK